MSFEKLGATQTSIALGWHTELPGENARLYRDGELIYEGTQAHFVDHGLAPNTTYFYQVNIPEERGLWGYVMTTETNGVMQLVTYRTEYDHLEGRRTGFYNVTDLIRVNEAIEHVANLLAENGYEATVATKIDWQLNDIPTEAQMQQYVDSIRSIRNAIELARTTPAAPATMDGLTWETANHIEQILVDVEYMVSHVLRWLKRSGQFDAQCGNWPMIATEVANRGRTWEQLDDMNTSWGNWQEATWFLLLYGNLEAEGDVD